MTFRYYDPQFDYELVSRFLVSSFRHRADGIYDNWLQPRWEYMHYHPMFNARETHRIGLWELQGSLIAVANYELDYGEVFFQTHPNFCALKSEMLLYAEDSLRRADGDTHATLVAWINDWDTDFETQAAGLGYVKHDEHPEFHDVYMFPQDLELHVPELPSGYQLQSFAEANDIRKYHRVMWRGFDNGPEPSRDFTFRRRMQSAPNFEPALNIVAVAPDGNYAAYSGIWFDHVNRVAYVEPVATDPDHRRRGLGKAVVLECIRRVKARGCGPIYVESGLPFYRDIGFRRVFGRYPWKREFTL